MDNLFAKNIAKCYDCRFIDECNVLEDYLDYNINPKCLFDDMEVEDEL